MAESMASANTTTLSIVTIRTVSSIE